MKIPLDIPFDLTNLTHPLFYQFTKNAVYLQHEKLVCDIAKQGQNSFMFYNEHVHKKHFFDKCHFGIAGMFNLEAL